MSETVSVDVAARAGVSLSTVSNAAITPVGSRNATAPETHQHRQVVFEPELVVRESTT